MPVPGKVMAGGVVEGQLDVGGGGMGVEGGPPPPKYECRYISD